MANQWNPHFLDPSRYQSPLDFIARRTHFADHIAPIWNELKDYPQRGKFYVPAFLQEYVESLGCTDVVGLTHPTNSMLIVPPGRGPILASAQGDLIQASRNRGGRPYMLMEHGVGIVFPKFSGYAGGLGMRRYVSLFLSPNETIAKKTLATFPTAFQRVVGTPKLDEWAIPRKPNKALEKTHKPVIAISFHWDGKAVAPEAGNAYAHYKDIVPELSKYYHVLGHGHPRIIDQFAPIWESHGFEVVRDFREVMARADLYINDCSSTLYEFLVTGRPVLILNAPWFRRNINYGIRFWDYTDIGFQVEKPEELLERIKVALIHDLHKEARDKTVSELYPHLGYSAKRTAGTIAEFIDKVSTGNVNKFVDPW